MPSHLRFLSRLIAVYDLGVASDRRVPSIFVKFPTRLELHLDLLACLRQEVVLKLLEVDESVAVAVHERDPGAGELLFLAAAPAGAQEEAFEEAFEVVRAPPQRKGRVDEVRHRRQHRRRGRET